MISSKKSVSEKCHDSENIYHLCKGDVKKCDEHEIIMQICDILGAHPDQVCKAEEIFNQIKYEVARYIVHHEYEAADVLPTENFCLWLEEKSSPAGVAKLNQTIKKYLK